MQPANWVSDKQVLTKVVRTPMMTASLSLVEYNFARLGSSVRMALIVDMEATKNKTER